MTFLIALWDNTISQGAFYFILFKQIHKKAGENQFVNHSGEIGKIEVLREVWNEERLGAGIRKKNEV